MLFSLTNFDSLNISFRTAVVVNWNLFVTLLNIAIFPGLAQNIQLAVAWSNLNQGWRWLSQFPPFRYFPNFRDRGNTRPLLNITFIFDMCHRSWAAVTPVKYECDSKNLTVTLAGSKYLLTEKLANGALATPTPGQKGPSAMNIYISIVMAKLKPPSWDAT